MHAPGDRYDTNKNGKLEKGAELRAFVLDLMRSSSKSATKKDEEKTEAESQKPAFEADEETIELFESFLLEFSSDGESLNLIQFKAAWESTAKSGDT